MNQQSGRAWIVADRSAFSRDSDLTGLWSGEYWYGSAVKPTPFSAHITDTLGSISGTTLEPATFGAPGLEELSADISGMRGELSVRFTKIYHPAPGVHRHPIHYTGTIDPNFTMIDGEWTFPNSYNGRGRFVLVRASRGAKAEAIVREMEVELKR